MHQVTVDKTDQYVDAVVLSEGHQDEHHDGEKACLYHDHRHVLVLQVPLAHHYHEKAGMATRIEIRRLAVWNHQGREPRPLPKGSVRDLEGEECLHDRSTEVKSSESVDTPGSFTVEDPANTKLPKDERVDERDVDHARRRYEQRPANLRIACQRSNDGLGCIECLIVNTVDVLTD